MLAWIAFFSLISVAFANKDDEALEVDDTPAPQASASSLPPKVLARAEWSLLIPVFVIHGTSPTGGAQDNMPRKIDPGGNAVFTPGVGFEYKGPHSLDVVVGLLKDCYNDDAGTIQIGQHWRFGKTSDFGYTMGLYIRQTPITCYTSTTSTGGNSGGGPGGSGGRPGTTDSFTTTSCTFEDNLPLRYTTQINGGYVDIIPTPFLNFSTEIYHGFIDVHLKIMSNFYLNEFGLSFPF